MSICRLDVKNKILDDINKEFIEGRPTYSLQGKETIIITNQGDIKKSSQAIRVAKTLSDRISKRYNNGVGTIISQASPYDPVRVDIRVSDRLVESYYEKIPSHLKSEQGITSNKEFKNGSTQLSLFGLDTTNEQQLEFHVNTLNVINQFLEKAGIEQRLVGEFLSQDGSIVEGALASANFIDGTVDIINDLEKRPSAWNKLPEEAAHWWYRLLDKQSDLKNALWNSHITELKNNELYKGKYGKLVKSPSDLTEESIGQLIAEAIKRIETKNANANDYSFFKKFIEWIKSLVDFFKNSEHDPFEVAAMKILSHDMSDLMTWDEYNKLNNIVYFDEQLTAQSTKPVDYSLIEDLGKYLVPGGVEEPGYRGLSIETSRDTIYSDSYQWKHYRDDNKVSPKFKTQVELDNWIFKNIPEYQQRQEKILQEVRDNQKFFDRLLNKTFRKKSKYLSKTLSKYYSVLDEQINDLPNFNIQSTSYKFTVKLSESEKKMLIQTNDYTHITPTLRVLPKILDKYKKNPISLSQDIKIDSAKKQELSILNSIREMIKTENPDKKSITAEEFVNEVHNWLETNYLLGFANEQNFLSYRVDQTFNYANGLSKNMQNELNNDIDLQNLTEEQLMAMPYQERQRISQILGLTKQNPIVYHNKVSLRFNDLYHLKHGHFILAPSAWGNLTYFYTGKNKFKDAVLLHEIQNDNIEELRESATKPKKVENELSNYLELLNKQFSENIDQIESGGKKIQRHKLLEIDSTGKPYPGMLYSVLSEYRNESPDVGWSALVNKAREIVDLSEANLFFNLEKYNIELKQAYSVRRKWLNFVKVQGGLKSILSKEDLENLNTILKEVNSGDEDSNDPNAYLYSDIGIADRKKLFRKKSEEISNTINKKLLEIYGANPLKVSLLAPAKPLPKSKRNTQTFVRRGETIKIGNASSELTENVNWLIAWNEQNILKAINKEINEAKKNWLISKKLNVSYSFNKSLTKMTLDQFKTLMENFKHNQDLLNTLVDKKINEEKAKLGKIDNNVKNIIKFLLNNGSIPVGDYQFKSSKVNNDVIVTLANDTKENSVRWTEDQTLEYIKKHKPELINQSITDFLKEKEAFNLKSKQEIALYKKNEIEREYDEYLKDLNSNLERELNYFTPLIHHLIQKHINQYGKDFPMYFSGYNITRLTQGNDRTALIYAGKEEIPYTKEQIDAIKVKAAQSLGLLKEFNINESESIEEFLKNKDYVEKVIKKLNDYKKESSSNFNRVVSNIMMFSNNKPIETGAIYNAMSQVSGVKLIWKDKIEGLINNPGGYLVDLSDYNYNTPVLYGLDNKENKPSSEKQPEKVKEPSKEITKASPQTIAKVKEFLKRIGVEYSKVKEIVIDGKVIDADAVADGLNRFIQIVEGKEDVILPEEAMHIAIEIIEQTNPKLFNQMFNQIGKYNIYQQVLEEYGDNKLYQDKETGKRDIRKLKKEAMGKLLAETFIAQQEALELKERIADVQSWWRQVVEWIKNLFSRVKFNPFETAAESIEKMSDGSSLSNVDVGQFFSLNSQQKKDRFNQDNFINLMKEMHNRISDPTNEGFYRYMGKEVKNRVTDFVKKRMKNYVSSDFDELRRRSGTGLHADIDSIIKRYVDENGYIRSTPLAKTFTSELSPNDDSIYKALESAIQARLLNYLQKDPKTRFLSEVRIYDPSSDTAGTIDFMAIDSNGKIDMLDWKLVDLRKGQKGAPLYKVESYQQQMSAYKDILVTQYGVPRGNFGLTAIIPIKASYASKKVGGQQKTKLAKISIGNVDYTQETDSSLLPITTTDFKTGNPGVDRLIKEMNVIVDNLKKQYRKDKNPFVMQHVLDDYISSIRKLQLQNGTEEVFETAKATLKKINQDTIKIEALLKGNNTHLDTKNIISAITNSRDILHVYENLNAAINPVIRGSSKSLTEEQKKLITESNNISASAAELGRLYDSYSDRVAEIIGSTVGIFNVDKAEKQLDWVDRTIRSFSQAGTKTAKIFYKLYQDAKEKAIFSTNEGITRLSKMEDNLDTLAKQKGISTMELYQKYLIRDHVIKNDDGTVNRTETRLIDRFDSAIRKQLKEVLSDDNKTKAREFVTKYIDLKEYNEYYEKQKKKIYATIDSLIWNDDEESNKYIVSKKKEEFEERYDLTKPSALSTNNDYLSFFLNSNAYSNDYKVLHEKGNENILNLYNYLINLNDKARKLGMIEGVYKYTFLPNIKKDYLDRITQGGNKSFLYSLVQQVKVNPGSDEDFGSINEITRLPEYTVPVNYVYELEKELKSADLIKTIALWEKEINEYEWKSELEDFSKLLLDVERRKDMLAPVKSGGKTKYEVIPKSSDTDKNTEYLKNFINYYIYNKRFIGNAEDLKFTFDYNKVASSINKKVGFNLISTLKEDEGKITISATKLVKAANRFFQMKILGFNLTTALSNLFGGTMNTMIKSGRYFTKEDYFNNSLILASSFAGEKGKLYSHLIDYFMPLLENQEHAQINKLSSSKVHEFLTSESLMILQRGSDKMISYPLLMSFADNTMVDNGQLVSIPDYVREKNGYLQRFNTPEKRREIETKIQKEINELKATKAISKTAKFVNGELVIDGIDRNSKTVWDFRNRVQQFTKDIMGNSTTEDIAQYRMSILGQSFMMFKNWIPRMALARFGGLREDIGKEEWEYGRLRIMAKMAISEGLSSFSTLRNLLFANEDGVKYMSKIYQEKLQKFIDEGGEEDEFISEDEFKELYFRQIRSAAKETMYWVATLGLLVAARMASAAVPPDDKTKGFRNFSLRAFDKMYDELGFFFSVNSFTDIANGKVFPAIGVITDGTAFLKHFAKQAGGVIFDEPEWEKSAKPMKYLFKTAPITKELLTWIAIFDNDLADDMGIKISNQYQVR